MFHLLYGIGFGSYDYWCVWWWMLRTSTIRLYPVYNSIITLHAVVVIAAVGVAIIVSIASRATVQFAIDNVVITDWSFIIIAVAIRIDAECTKQRWGWTTQHASTTTAATVIGPTIALDASLAHIIASLLPLYRHRIPVRRENMCRLSRLS
jgi:hypothetical protein